MSATPEKYRVLSSRRSRTPVSEQAGGAVPSSLSDDEASASAYATKVEVPSGGEASASPSAAVVEVLSVGEASASPYAAVAEVLSGDEASAPPYAAVVEVPSGGEASAPPDAAVVAVGMPPLEAMDANLSPAFLRFEALRNLSPTPISVAVVEQPARPMRSEGAKLGNVTKVASDLAASAEGGVLSRIATAMVETLIYPGVPVGTFFKVSADSLEVIVRRGQHGFLRNAAGQIVQVFGEGPPVQLPASVQQEEWARRNGFQYNLQQPMTQALLAAKQGIGMQKYAELVAALA
eukprot:TRINITY_DN30025_c0_g1_i1.p1 TRINITY_DN30025_c0_g1~~TRINITY_DN30025_c0_g1_i1.p1  ORF type:complete len:292 (+),score=49.08 TRINITY_DN30025_c0_g1_i1:64-939(+)